MSIFSRIFATPDDASKIVDGAVKGLDALVFTDEERSRADAKLAEWYLKYLSATEGQNLARRLIAMVVVFVWSGLLALGLLARFVEVWFQRELVERTYPLSDFVFTVLVDIVLTPFSIVIGFYFLTHAVRAYKKD